MCGDHILARRVEWGGGRKGIAQRLAPAAEKLLARHMGVAKEWFPHEFIPYSRGRDFVPGEQWVPENADFGDVGHEMDEAVRTSLFVNLLTEDNLPYYTRDINSLFGSDSAFGEWGRNWTAEEGRHSIVIRDYLTVTRAMDPVALERARMQQVRGGQVPTPSSLFEALAYLSMQGWPRRSRIATPAKLMKDEIGSAIMSRVGNDENLHYLFYRDLASAALEIDPSSMVIGMEQAVRTFSMPGIGITDFDRMAREIARAGIYDLAIHHDQILEPVIMRHWKIMEIEGLSPVAEQARVALIKRIERTGRVGKRLASERVNA